MLDGGPAGLPIPAGWPWRHDGYRMHLSGSGARLDRVVAGFAVMEGIESDSGTALVLHPDRAELRVGPARDRLATSLELPLFCWERGAGDAVSWVTPLQAATVEPGAPQSRIVLRSEVTGERVLFETSSGRIAASDGGRLTWECEESSRLIVVAAADEGELERSLDLLARRGVTGIGRQRAQHAEQLHRGGVAMRAAPRASLADAFEWGKIRADALLGGWIAGHRKGMDDAGVALQLADGLLAAGLSQHARMLRRGGPAPGIAGAGDASGFAAWMGEPPAASDSADDRRTGDPAAPGPSTDLIAVPDPVDIATGRVGAEGVASFLAGAVRGLWGVEPDAPRAAVRLDPNLQQLGPSAALSRLRVGRTVLDVRLRHRGEIVSMAIRRGAGPPIMMDCTVRGAHADELLVDGQAIGGGRARFEVRESHDVQLHLRAGPPLSSAPS